LQEQLRALIERHCVTLREHVDAVGRNLRRSFGPPEGDLDALAEAESLAHQLKGSSGSIGFSQVSAAATTLDDHLKTLCALGGRMNEAQRARLFELYDELRTIAEAISPEKSTLYHATLNGTPPPRNSAQRS